MKKGLSVLLIAAALFGFYGGATNLNDVLACKDYFTSASGASDDMQRLEDGLNQLKDNEQAYLDGQVALAEGEQALADAAVQLADGEAKLADGEKQYAAGLAAYKAAPAQLADGEKQLEEGKSSYSDLKTLIKGLKKAQKHGVDSTPEHDEYWHDGFSHTVSNSVLKKMAAGEKTDDSPGLQQARQVIVSQFSQEDTAKQIAMIGQMVGDKNLAKDINDKATYKAFDKNLLKLVKAFKKVSDKLKDFAKLANGYAANEELSGAATLLTDDDAADAKAAASADEIVKGVMAKAKVDETTAKGILSDTETAKAYGLEEYAKQYQGLVAYKGNAIRPTVRETVASQMADAKDSLGDNLSLVQQLSPELYQGIATSMQTLIANSSDTSNADYAKSIKSFQGYLAKLGEELNKLAGTLDGNAETFKTWDKGYKTLAYAKNGKTSDEHPDDLASPKKGIPFAFQNMVTNKTIKAAINKHDPKLMSILRDYAGNKGKNKLANEDMDEFDEDIVYLGEKVIPRALNVLAKVKSDAEKQLADGKKQLADGKKSYAEAPAKLADARKQLADGRAQLADGYAQYADGEKQLEDGKAQLAQYEDGEQQVRDGLATLVGTDAMGNVQSIADRIGNDTDFDNGDNHLELDEGLSAVQAGKGYAADLTAAVTDEIMGRAVGTGILLGAGVLAVLAALLSFLKKNKGAGVFALLAAAAGCVGAVMGNGAGTQFSSIAGSTVGATPWIAAGILAAVAAVHAIVHFAAKKAA